MQNICVVLFGEAREYKACKLYLDKALQGFDVDYVGHAWNTITAEPLGIHHAVDVDELQLSIQQHYNSSHITVDDYKREFQRLSQPFRVSNPSITNRVSAGSGMSQWRSFEKATKALKNSILPGKSYDLIICTRYDIAWKREIDMNIIIDAVKNTRQVEDDRIIITEKEYGHRTVHGTTMQDLIFFGSLNGMLQLGKNFTRNRLKHIIVQDKYEKVSHTLNKTERKLYSKYVNSRNYRQYWGLQILENSITRKIINSVGKIRIVRYGCPSYDFDTITNYEFYFNYYKRPENRGSIREYDPEVEYMYEI